jgi:predicted transcriptional regulator
MKYRSRSEIIAMILQAANKGATKTRIMYGAYLSYAQVQEYLKFLQEKELLSYEQGTHLYKLSEKGLHYLHAFDQINDIISVSGKATVPTATVDETVPFESS